MVNTNLFNNIAIICSSGTNVTLDCQGTVKCQRRARWSIIRVEAMWAEIGVAQSELISGFDSNMWGRMDLRDLGHDVSPGYYSLVSV